MFYLFSKIKFRLILILIFSIIFYSCENVKTTYIDKENMPVEKEHEFQGDVIKIDGLFLKNGKYMDVRDKNAVINFTDNPKTIIYDISDTEKASIAFDDVSTFKVSISEGNIGLTILIIAVAAAALFVAALILLVVAFAHGHFNATGG